MGYDGVVTIKIDAETKSFEEEIKQTEEYLNKLVSSYEKVANMKGKLKPNEQAMANLRKEIEKTNNKLVDLKEKQNKINQGGLPNLKDIMEDIGKSTKQTIKSIGKWALAVFSLRSAYMLVRNAINTIAGDDEQLKADIEYMKNALAYSLEPVIRKIVDFAKQLMFYVGYIIKAWTGKNIFENANKSLSNANKNAQKLSKTMAGFDEMNVLNDNGSTGAMGAVAPSLDLATPEDVPIPSWIQWIADNKDILIAGLTGIAGGLMAIFLGLTLIQGLGIGLILAGIVLLIQGIVDFIKDPSWDNFLTILMGISLVVAGIAVLMGGWIVALVALGVAIVAYIIKNWDKVKEILGKVGSWIYDKIIKPVGDFFVGLWDGIVNGVKTAVQWVKDAFSSVVSFFSNLISKIVNLFKTI